MSVIRTTGMVLVAACGLLVFYPEGLYWITLWNLPPLLAAGIIIRRSTGVSVMSSAAFVFAFVTTFAVTFVHLAWIFDWGGTQTGSSVQQGAPAGRDSGPRWVHHRSQVLEETMPMMRRRERRGEPGRT